MPSCQKCGYELSETDKVCPNCGAPVAAEPTKVELVESAAVEAVIISEKGFTFRVRNTGTALFVVRRIVFYNQPTEIVGFSPVTAKENEPQYSIPPGAVAEVTFKTDYSGVSGLSYPVVMESGSGKSYEVSVGFP